ncbi:MAG: FAD:protein FMN transferase [Flavobacteriaceae bacterium]|nr:FAD:protein FMN transferase [Flavobacteriaceae bacterium]
MKIYLSLFFCLISFTIHAQDKSYTKVLKLMGSRFEITVVAENEVQSSNYIQIAVDEIVRIEKLISEWDPNSQVSEINRQAGLKAIKVDQELFDLIKRSIQISKLTQGAFDISFASMDKIWKFDGSMKSMPTSDEIKKSVAKIGFQNIILDEVNSTVFLKNEGMKIGFGAIGKGYAADKTKKLMIDLNVKAGIINASGDLNSWGKQPNGESWKVGITNPLNKEKVFSWLPIDNSAVVTSGNYEKFVEFDGVRYTHIINPKTGYPVTGLNSVTIFSQSAELADALATAVFVMGLETGLDFINQLKNIECVIIDSNNKIHQSKNIKLNTY